MSHVSDALVDAQEREIERLKAENDELKAKVLWLEVVLIEMAYERCSGGDLIEHIKAKVAGKTGKVE